MRNRIQESFFGDQLQLLLMLALTFSTGVSDAVGYLGLDRVFTGNMTGNVVILGMALAGAENLKIWGPLVGLLAFLLGAFLAGRLMRGIPTHWNTRKTIAFLVAGLIMTIAALLMWLQPGLVLAPWSFGITALLALGMGTQAGTARHLATADVNTVVITTTLIGLAADSRFSSAKGQLWMRRTLSIGLIGLGAVAGSLLLRVHPALGVALSAVIILAVAIIGQLRLVRDSTLEPM